MREIRFGTDGVRARHGDWPLTETGIRQIGRALAVWCSGGRVVVGRDTRQSSPQLSDALCTGLMEGGSTVLDGGVLPTAAVSCAVVDVEAAAGVMITASHNPWHDNGVKILNAAGRKPTASEMSSLEALFGQTIREDGRGRRAVFSDPAYAWRARLPVLDLDGVRILLDCAHGAAAPHAPAYLESLGATLVRRGCAPDGKNINDGVGAMHPPTDLQGCDLAICLDGDADRLMMVVPGWGTLDGDDMLWLLAQDATGPVVGTLMTNGGLEAALGGRLRRSKVGDRYVSALMAETGARFGAETSGHVLFSDGMPTGDGLYAALRILRGRGRAPKLLLPLAGWRRLPTFTLNIRFTGERISLDTLQTPAAAEAAGQRVIIRYSGTEPVLRILVEGDDGEMWLERIAAEFSAA